MMNSVTDVWNSILDILSKDLTATSINTWFSDCRPVELSDTRLVLYTPTDFKRNIITQRYAAPITTALTDLFSCPFDLLVLAEDELEKVFEPFYRTEASRNRETGGTGLGLAITRNLLHAQGGEVTLRNHPDGGLEAVVRLRVP